MRHQLETRRKQQTREAQLGESLSARWLGEMQEGDGEQQVRRGVSRRCEVVRSRIRLGYPYAWQIGIATTEEKRKCRLCGAQDEHSLEHY